jgi:hypothetical protein
MHAAYDALPALLSQYAARPHRPVVVAGFDGFIDEMTSVVGERRSLTDWTPIGGIPDFGAWVNGAAGRSALREIVMHRADPGGCAVNLGDGLNAMGVELHAFATLGDPIHPAFRPFVAACASCTSWAGVHGRTIAFEFTDGKIMLCSVSQLADLDVACLDRHLADGVYSRRCAQAQVIVLTNWTLYPHMTQCWLRLIEQVYSKLTQKPRFFIDLVDPTARSQADIGAMLAVLPQLQRCGPVTLGVNGNEGNVLARVLGLSPVADEPAAVEAQARELRTKLGVEEVVTHSIRFSAAADAAGSASVPGPWCKAPVKSTGAGDRYNAGTVLGHCLGLDLNARLALGNLSSGFFVRQARSGSALELARFGQELVTDEAGK